MDFRSKRVLIIGGKRSGVAAAALLRKQGVADLQVMDSQPLKAEERAPFDALGVPVVLQNTRDPNDLEADIIVLSPGVPNDLLLLTRARERGAHVLGEVELASYFLAGPVIGITGSNGKTTTTALTAHLLKESGICCQVGGNIGTALTSLVESSRSQQWNVLELSSFQLETIEHFRADLSACLNITPDHLDRHGTLENYVAAKRRLFETQTASGCAVLNYDDEACRAFAKVTKARVYWFSVAGSVPEGISLKGDELVLRDEPFMRRSAIRLRGVHNLENVMAAALLADLAGAPLTALEQAVESFPGVEHRIEFVRTLDGVDYFNDSKATNVDATLKAVAAFENPLWLILGGKDKGSDYGPLRHALAHHARAVLLIGAEPYESAAAPLIRKALDGVLPLVDCGEMAAAVRYAREHASPGDVVLLAPACASFDQFRNYEERGRAFKQIVSELL